MDAGRDSAPAVILEKANQVGGLGDVEALCQSQHLKLLSHQRRRHRLEGERPLAGNEQMASILDVFPQ